MKLLPVYNRRFKILHKEFELYAKTVGYNRGKDSHYPDCVNEFLFFIENRNIKNICDVTASEIIAYKIYLSERPNQLRSGGISDSWIKTHLFSLRLFFDYLIDTNQVEYSPAHLPKFSLKKYKERNILTNEEIKQLYSICESREDRAILSLAYGCGLRRSEMQNLNLADVNLNREIIIIRDGKNHKNRTVPMSVGVIKDIREYIIYERMNYFTKGISSNAFFLNKRCVRKNGENINLRLKQMIIKTRNPVMASKEITLHCLRHSIATHLFDNGAPIEYVKQFLGHSDIDTAMVYSKRRKQHMKILNQLR